MRTLVALAAVGLLVVEAGVARVHAAPQAVGPPASAGHAVDLSMAFAGASTSSLGTMSADLLTGDGSPLPVFATENRLGAGAGLEGAVSMRVGRRLSAELSGSWMRGQIETRISADVDGADALTLTTPVSQFALEGAALWTLRRRGRAEWFARGAAGWLRGLSSDRQIAGNGHVANAGGGVKYWWRQGGGGLIHRLGIRAEARLTERSNVFHLGDRRHLVAGTFLAGLLIGF